MMECIEEVINLTVLVKNLEQVIAAGRLAEVTEELSLQARVEFNYEDDDEMEVSDDA